MNLKFELKTQTKLKTATKTAMTVSVRELGTNMGTENVSSFMDFINELVRENVYISKDTLMSYENEYNYLEQCCSKVMHGQAVYLIAEHNNMVIAKADAEMQHGKQKHNIIIGIAILKPFRGAGLGTFMLKQLIKIVKKKLNPKNIAVACVKDNEPARKLYEKLGFKPIACFPNWVRQDKGQGNRQSNGQKSRQSNAYYDLIWMLLK
jgi:RimJ/RimL family protein N-acetyltransferase